MRQNKENDPFLGLGLLITLKEKDDFLKIKETLTRIGNEETNESSTGTLHQICYILHKRGQYAIIHQNELLVLDGKENKITDGDLECRNTIVKLLNEWNLLTMDNPELLEYLVFKPTHEIKFVSFKEKHKWNLESHYDIGTKKGSDNNGNK